MLIITPILLEKNRTSDEMYHSTVRFVEFFNLLIFTI